MLELSAVRLVRACAPTLFLLVAVVSGGAAVGVAAEERGREVVARVNGVEVYAEEVDRELQSAFGEDVDLEKLPPEARQRAAEQVVNRRLVLLYLIQTKQSASEEDVTYAMEQLKKELTAQNSTLADYFRRSGWREEDFRSHLAWTLSWQKFLERTLTDANLQKYYDRHLPDFDGREVRVAHLLLKVEAGDSAGQLKSIAEAKRIREEVASGKLSFASAVRKYSQAPAADRGGDLGFIRRREPMPESFAKAALWLEKGAVSQPVVTNVGVHLIQCLEVRPGERSWRDAESELRKAVALYLFEWAAEKQRSSVRIDWMRPKAVGVVENGP